MFDSLSDKLESFFKKVKGQAKFSEKNISEISQNLRMTLLEADVNFKVAKVFVDNVKQRSLGQKVHESLTPQKHYIDIVRRELTEILGSTTAEINLRVTPPLVIMMVGLQGSGKTTTSAKLAKYLTEEKKRSPFLVSVDIYRPAAMDQLKTVAAQVNVPSFDAAPDRKPIDICRDALGEAERRGRDTVIIDTAGRLHIDEALMNELVDIKKLVNPHEILLVADAMTGQEAVRIAKKFHEFLALTGIILSKADADARGGAALSMKYITGQPIKFVGVGEKLDALEVFHPDRMASRILKMGDMLTLIEKTKKAFGDGDSELLERKIRKNSFTLDDFKQQMKQIKKMGSFTDIMKMIPGMGSKMGQAMKSLSAGGAAGVDPDKELKKVAAVIDSMTPLERRRVDILNGSRRLRIARGSGTQVSDVNKLVKQFLQTKKMMKKMSKFGRRAPTGLF